MISDTAFDIEEARMVRTAAFLAQLRHTRLITPAEVRDLEAQCESGSSMCIACDDGIVVFTLRPQGDDIELFVQLAVAHRIGAFGRQESAVRAIARDLGARTIAFQSRRPGWARRLGPEWQRRGTTEFVRSA